MLRRIVTKQESYLLIAIVIISLITVAVHPNFLKASNITSILVSASIFGFIALGETFVILGRGIDLSVSATLGLSALVIGMTANQHHIPIVIGVIIGVVLGIVLGTVNGMLVIVGKVPPIIATLATLTVYGALEFVYTNGNQVNSMPNNFDNLGNASYLGIPVIVLIFVVAVAVCWYFAKYTQLGRDIYATGNDRQHAESRGIKTSKAIFSTYVISGLLAGIAGLLFISYYTTATAATGPGTSYELSAIAISLIGGTALTGGRANFVSVAIASVFLAMTLTVAVFFGVPGIWDPAAEGFLILAVVLGDAFLTSRSGRRSVVELKRIISKGDVAHLAGNPAGER